MLTVLKQDIVFYGLLFHILLDMWVVLLFFQWGWILVFPTNYGQKCFSLGNFLQAYIFHVPPMFVSDVDKIYAYSRIS